MVLMIAGLMSTVGVYAASLGTPTLKTTGGTGSTAVSAPITGTEFEADADGKALAEDFAAIVLPLLRRAVELRSGLGDAAALADAQRALAGELAAAGRLQESLLLLEEIKALGDAFR